MLSLAGVFAAFYALKSKGDYLRRLNELSGLAESKPFIAASMLVFMVSLLGFPPLLGFLGMVSVMNNLVAYQEYFFISVLMIGIVVLAAAYLRVIKTFYFDTKRSNFDRVDNGIYFVLVLFLIVVLVLVLNPKYFMSDNRVLANAMIDISKRDSRYIIDNQDIMDYTSALLNAFSQYHVDVEITSAETLYFEDLDISLFESEDYKTGIFNETTNRIESLGFYPFIIGEVGHTNGDCLDWDPQFTTINFFVIMFLNNIIPYIINPKDLSLLNFKSL